VAAFRHGIGEAGFVEGQNLAIAFRWAEGRYDRLPALVAELVNLRVAVLFAAGGPPSALAAKEATSTIPVVFSAVSDPVRLGLVPSLNRGTGMSLLNSELVAKSAQLLKEAVKRPVPVQPAPSDNAPTRSGIFRRFQNIGQAILQRLHLLLQFSNGLHALVDAAQFLWRWCRLRSFRCSDDAVLAQIFT
jgi:ABC transporter substrate binding protein